MLACLPLVLSLHQSGYAYAFAGMSFVCVFVILGFDIAIRKAGQLRMSLKHFLIIAVPAMLYANGAFDGSGGFALKIAIAVSWLALGWRFRYLTPDSLSSLFSQRRPK